MKILVFNKASDRVEYFASLEDAIEEYSELEVDEDYIAVEIPDDWEIHLDSIDSYADLPHVDLYKEPEPEPEFIPEEELGNWVSVTINEIPLMVPRNMDRSELLMKLGLAAL